MKHNHLKHKHEKGQGLVEYALILVLVAIVVISVLTLMGPQIANVFSTINVAIPGGAPTPTGNNCGIHQNVVCGPGTTFVCTNAGTSTFMCQQ